ncbi:carboxypeptidase-like regulatory domain-containing protein [Tellurirhabdus bombi]|uniref:carboxypeptidase-like regulatory domain-containing protein n=1 Tax=Tellurirhabdus bombi TaxID=2907205 RepID=UPI001F487B47|nr:carboxypeptidase-like regulatory domain-containing protein [Tellurirhabdus bombi]
MKPKGWLASKRRSDRTGKIDLFHWMPQTNYMLTAIKYSALFALLLFVSCSKREDQPVRVYGTVVDSLGAPLSGVHFELMIKKRDTFPTFILPIAEATSAQDGSYEIKGVVPKDYKLPFVEITHIDRQGVHIYPKRIYTKEANGKLQQTTALFLKKNKTTHEIHVVLY